MAIDGAEIDDIVALGDDIERNRRITAAYATLTAEFAEVVDADNRPWTAFGAWTSAQVGAAVRGEVLDRHRVLGPLTRRLPWVPGRAVRARTALAAGNTDVFDHLGRAFAGFLKACRAPGPDAAAAVVAGMDPHPWGDGVVPSPVSLQDAFEAYAAAASDGDGPRRARSILWGNVALAVVEQSRVQPHLETAFWALAPTGRRRGPHPLAAWARRGVERALTEFVLAVPLGEHRVRPGKGLPGEADPVALTGVTAVDARFTRFGDLLTDRDDLEAAHWSDLGDRLRYIAALMRRLQQDASLAHPPAGALDR